MLYLIECSSCTTTLDTFLNDNFRFVEPAKCLTCNVLKRKGWKLKKTKLQKDKKLKKIRNSRQKIERQSFEKDQKLKKRQKIGKYENKVK